jgi:hypothetical protein
MAKVPAIDNQRTRKAVDEWNAGIPIGVSFTPTRVAAIVCDKFDLDPAGRGGQTIAAMLVRDHSWTRDRYLLHKIA